MSNPTSKVATRIAEKLYNAGCGHVMEVKEMAAIIEAEFTTGASADGQDGDVAKRIAEELWPFFKWADIGKEPEIVKAVTIINRHLAAPAPTASEKCYAEGDEGAEFCGEPRSMHCKVLGDSAFWKSIEGHNHLVKCMRDDHLIHHAFIPTADKEPTPLPEPHPFNPTRDPLGSGLCVECGKPELPAHEWPDAIAEEGSFDSWPAVAQVSKEDRQASLDVIKQWSDEWHLEHLNLKNDCPRNRALYNAIALLRASAIAAAKKDMVAKVRAITDMHPETPWAAWLASELEKET